MPSPDIQSVIITGAGGALGKTHLRSVFPSGYTVASTDLEDSKIEVLGFLSNEGEGTKQEVIDVVTGETAIPPFTEFSRMSKRLNINGRDLTERRAWRDNPFKNYDAVILLAANPDQHQSRWSARTNFAIDKKSIDEAIDADCNTIIYFSSVWRTMTHADAGERVDPEMLHVKRPLTHYGRAKEKTVHYMAEKAQQHPDILFIYNDHGHYPRKTVGAPHSNIHFRGIQTWVAECEAQEHILRQLMLRSNPNYKDEIASGRNLFGFNVISNNQVPEDVDHPQFKYDLSTSEKLGVKHQFNVYDVLKNHDSSWRRIPIMP